MKAIRNNGKVFAKLMWPACVCNTSASPDSDFKDNINYVAGCITCNIHTKAAAFVVHYTLGRP